MVVTTVMVRVKQEHVQDFIDATVINHRASVLEPGNMRFDILQRREDPCMFIMYEAYESDEAAAAHKNTEHYRVWRETVADFMEKPREGIKYTVIAP